MDVVATILPSPVAALSVRGRGLVEIAGDCVGSLPVVGSSEVPEDAVVVLVDPACPGVPADFVAGLVERCVHSGRPQVAVRPVTDTVKALDGDRVGATLDREQLATVVTPVVLPPGVRCAVTEPAGLVEDLRGRGAVDLVEAPAGVVRIEDADDLRLFSALHP